MSITLTEEPRSFTQKRQKLIYFGSSSNVSQTGFKYGVSVDVTASPNPIKYYIDKNPSGYFVFDLASTIRDRINIDVEDAATGGVIHSLPHASDKFMSVGTKGCVQFVVGFFEVYGDPLVEQPTLVADVPILLSGGFNIRDGFKPELTDYEPDGNTKKAFLTERVRINGEVRIKASEQDYGTLSFLNDSGTYISSGATKLRYRIYNSVGLQGTEVFTITTTYGTQLPAAADAAGKLTYFGAFPANVNDSNHGVSTGFKPEDITDWTYYTWELLDDSLNVMSEPIYIDNTANPCKHESVNLAWANNLGAWDYWRFDARTKRSVKTTRKEYQKSVGDYSGSSWSMNAYDRETKPYHVDSKLLFELQSESLSSEESDYIKNVMTSDNVMMYIDNQWLPVNVTNNSLSFQKEPISNRLVTNLSVELAQTEC